MKAIFKSALLSVALAVGIAPVQANTLDDLLKDVKSNRAAEKKINSQREAEFKSARADKQALLRKAQAELKAEQERGERLRKQHADNEIRITEKNVELENAIGTLGEMFGVVRQASSEAYGKISSSIVSAQFPGRADFLQDMASESRALPRISELEELWIAILTEMTESGKIARFQSDVVDLEGGTTSQEIVRVGTFNLVGDEGYLLYNAEDSQVQPLGRQPDSHIVSAAADYRNSNSGYQPLFLDPGRGAILSLLTGKATWSERYHAGGPVGYTITAMLVFGILLAIYKIITLTITGGKIKAQLKNTSNPSSSNPLGRILSVYHENKATADVENIELKLDEAILRELPSIESGVNLIKILSAIAPLLGLLGTVIGMIETFQNIVLYGTGDPKVMAGSISMALVTTAQGIIAALPLILLHSVVAGRSKAITHVLDEQAAGIVAAHAEAEKA